MAIVKCANGHFYDTNKTDGCPVCKKKGQNGEMNSPWQDNIPRVMAGAQAINEQKTVAMLANGLSNEVDLSRQGQRQSGMAASDSEVTVGIFKKNAGTALVVGWLVVTKGMQRGRDYRIAPGINWLGRSFNMDICVHDVEGIEDEKHCAIVYDDRGNAFYVLQGTGNITYLNGDMVKGSQKLKNGDELTIGSNTFEFIPFCREGHVWKAEEEESKD